ncbi:MAG: T9SS type A sorting domain-containing protein [Flavobacteriales bacterium]|nr:T9SS type A sorting domain-containing protein [Flavobacteriales bacterium]
MVLAVLLASTDRAVGQFHSTLSSPTGHCGISRVELCWDGSIAMGSISWGFDGTVHLTRFNATGDTVWTRIYGQPGVALMGYDLAPANENGWYLCAVATNYMIGSSSGLVIRVDSTGLPLWSRSIERWPSVTPRALDRRPGVQDQGVVVLCRSGGGSSGQTHLVAFDALGDTLWTHSYPDLFGIGDLVVRPDGKAAFVSTASVNDSLRMVLAVVSATGQPETAHQYDLGSGAALYGHSLAFEPVTGRYWIGGSSSNGIDQYGMIWCISDSLDPLTAVQLDGDTGATAIYAIELLEQGGAWGVGAFHIGTIPTRNLAVRLDELCSVLEVRSVDDGGWESGGSSVRALPDGGLLIGGGTTVGSISFGTLSKVDTLGNAMCTALSAPLTSTNMTLVHGPYSVAVVGSDLEVDSATCTMSAGLLLEHPCGSLGVIAEEGDTEWTVYPVPTTGTITVVGSVAGDLVQLMDALGRPLMAHVAGPGPMLFDLSEQPDGMYLLVAEGRSARAVRRVIVQR